MVAPSAVNFRMLQTMRIDNQEAIDMVPWSRKIIALETNLKYFQTLVNPSFGRRSTKLTWPGIPKYDAVFGCEINVVLHSCTRINHANLKNLHDLFALNKIKPLPK